MKDWACVARIDPVQGTAIIRCGHPYEKGHFCNAEVARIELVAYDPEWRYASFGQEWDNRKRTDGVVVRTGAVRVRQGHAPVRAPRMPGRPVRRTFSFPIRAKCDACGWINYLDPVVLDLKEVQQPNL